MEKLNILVLSDLYYMRAADCKCNISARKSSQALEFVARVIESIRGETVDLVVLLGDLVDDSNTQGAEEDLGEIKNLINKTGIPVIVVPGNHDGFNETALKIFDDHKGLHNLRGYQIVTFADSYDARDQCTRHWDGMKEVFAQVKRHVPTLVFQHNPIYTPINSKYPYNIENSKRIMDYYSKNGVILSISGHAHGGIPLCMKENVGYLSCPALCEDPYRYTMITITGREFEIKQSQLKVPEECSLFDLHVHTHLAYCAKSEMLPWKSIKRAEVLGLSGIAFTEHALQLYVSREDCGSGRIFNEPHLLYENKGTESHRIIQYRQAVESYRTNSVLLGLEVEVDAKGKLLLLEEDSDGWDILLGAVHWIPEKYLKRQEIGFMWANEMLVQNGVDILAHPFRYFVRKGIKTPKDLYRPLARLLAQNNTAAELNFHTNTPDLEFFIICLEEGVKISLGSDAHQLFEVGLNGLYEKFLREICDISQWNEMLFKPEIIE